MKAKEELKELKAKSTAELIKLIASSREKIRDLRFKASQNQLKNIKEIGKIRKKVAQLMTILAGKKDEPVKNSEVKKD